MNPNIPKARCGAFTLMELITVIGVIAILVAVGVGSLRFGGESAKLRAGVAELEAAFESAGQIARSRGQAMRVVLHADAGAPSRYLRQFGVAEVAGETAEGDPIWRLTAPPQSLRAGVFFDPTRTTPGISGGDTTAALPGPDGAPEDWWIFEFDGAGAFRQPGAQVVLAMGVDPGGGEGPMFPNPESADGFLVTAAGRTLRFENAGQMNSNREGEGGN